jgi:hypothetical protein
MAKPLDIAALLHRGGEMTAAEMKQLSEELTEAKLFEMSAAVSARSLDQPVKVVPFSKQPPCIVQGYFTQQKFIWGKTPEEMERILGVFGKFQQGVCVLEFEAPLKPGDFENRAYTYLPDGREFQPGTGETMYLPGKGAPQWVLTRKVQAKCIATLIPGQAFGR